MEDRSKKITIDQILSEAKTAGNQYSALINRAGGLYGRILTEVASTDRTQ